MSRPSDADIASALMALADGRGAGKSFCPSEAARALSASNWRSLMPDVRRVAASLPLAATQKGLPVDPLTATGPIRLGLPLACLWLAGARDAMETVGLVVPVASIKQDPG